MHFNMQQVCQVFQWWDIILKAIKLFGIFTQTGFCVRRLKFFWITPPRKLMNQRRRKPRYQSRESHSTHVSVSFTDLSCWVSPLTSFFQLLHGRRVDFKYSIFLMRVKVRTSHGRIRAIKAMITFNMVCVCGGGCFLKSLFLKKIESKC